MVEVTALRSRRPGRVAVELDGAPWRVLPSDVAVTAGLAVGERLDRARLRDLRRELRRHEALAAAAGTLRHRDLSSRALEARLARRSVRPPERAEALQILERAGVVDDTRFGAGRARALAERGWGDAAIRDDLERQAVPDELIGPALEALAPETDRARALVLRRGGGQATARWLARKGFGEDAIESATASPIADDP
ncbi:MAG TPA: RecX family transcriptional regulator [Gaiellaceae bacterium]|nr:RecX family transcriptional regulator [Gaiellaceae bacterium]